MTFSIAISGKGGVGKTTFAALVVDYVTRKLNRTVLAVDADPNANFNDVLGVESGPTIADVRDKVEAEKLKPPGAAMSKERLVQMEIQQAVQECGKFDLLTMGRPEGPGCYCYVNNLLRENLGQLAENYPCMVVDNEAGMEHISRRTTNHVDVLFVVTEPTVVGVKSARNVFDITATLPVEIKNLCLVLNRVPAGGPSEAITRLLERNGLEPQIMIGLDDEVAHFAAEGKSLLELSAENPMRAAVAEIVSRYLK